MDFKKLDYIILIFVISVFLLTFESYICKYNLSLYCEVYFVKNMWYENGLVESLQFVFLLIAIFYLVFVIKKYQNKLNRIINIFLIINICGLFYFAGEEISWGQHFFSWSSPEFFQELNNQKETNLHNISNLFDQLPRTLVMIWCCASAIIIKSYKRFFILSDLFYYTVFPNKRLIYISILLTAFIVPDLIVDKFNLHSGYVTASGIDIPAAKYWDMVSLNFIRLSELHEYIFSFYFMIHSIMLKKTISAQ